ncbi:hypothetical protein [Geomesophilobacter sediminis]|uniref:Uncharacterized protein n=1 Tax=Geomesophilobacter sediminis TaxID=2798584 RepID=A0A8J7JG65_9BACT|nr:hypothetical protein [Geomesophilobacter sediminis]MBJ6723435.1 hypothetical protein [Geomesophilobacter sediminis]
MNKVIRRVVGEMAEEFLEYLKEKETQYQERWVPSVRIEKDLDLHLFRVPKSWFLRRLTRMLEASGEIEHFNDGTTAYFRTVG